MIRLIRNKIIIYAVIAGIPLTSFARVNQSAVVTATFPHGSRQCGMGEVGTALADDANCIFWNPAGLGIRNEKLQRNTATMFWEPLLPAFGLKELWHMQQSACMQYDGLVTRGLGFDFNYINAGKNNWTAVNGRNSWSSLSYEWISTVAYGYSIADMGFGQSAIGFSYKYINSAFTAGYEENREVVGQTYAFDAGLLWQILPAVRFGLTLANMGPGIYYIDPEKTDPLPFTINLALAYHRPVIKKIPELLDINAELRLHREFVKNYLDRHPDPFYRAIRSDWNDASFRENMKEIEYNFGMEITILNSVKLRHGSLIDRLGRRYELHWGAGMSTSFGEVDYYYIFAPEGCMGGAFDNDGATGARDGQWGITATFYGGMLNHGACKKK